MKILKVALVALFLLVGVESAFADNDKAAKKGQKLFIKKYKSACGFNGAVMAGKHSQDEWEYLYENDGLVDEMKSICPKIQDVPEKYLPFLYQFYYKYANDSGNVPSC
jgi:hypothetical protein